MELAQFCSASRVVIVAGKGGVGKTTVTATLATAAARTGASVLIVEVEGKSGLASAFGCEPLEYADFEVAPGIRARTLTPDQALLEYLEDRGLRRFSRRLTHSGALDVVATAVPGMREILVLGKVKALERSGVADLILIDAPAAGHAIGFLMSPRGLTDAVRIGPVRAQAEDVIEMLSDPERCRVILVTLPEETPVNELVDTAYALEDRVGIKLGPIVVNGWFADAPEPSQPAARDAALVGLALEGDESARLDAAAAFRHERHLRQQAQVERLAQRLPLAQVQLPFLFHDIHRPQLETLADHLTGAVAAIPAGGAP
ncbi:MAG TPA: ArsA-related P-loop ATPase [Acidimicrobiia bacterium]|nr:ArsA-related P-loop ATPase [Acidimicrobiia bacterium]